MHPPGGSWKALSGTWQDQLLEALTSLSGGTGGPFSSSSVEHQPRGVVVFLTRMEQDIGEVRLGRGRSTSVTVRAFHGTRKYGCIFPRHIPRAPPSHSQQQWVTHGLSG